MNGNKRLHKSNGYSTHLELESGTSLRVLSKSPVNDKLYDLSFQGKSYQNGTPTPTAPIALTHTPSQFDLTSCGKNLFDFTLYSSSYVTLLSNGYSVTGKYVNIFTNKLILLPNTTYTVSCSVAVSGTATGAYGRLALFTDDGSSTIILKDGYASGSFVTTFTTPANISEFTKIYIYGSSTTSAITAITNIQIELGSTATDYRPYTGQTQTINVKDSNGNTYQLGSLPDGTADTFNKNNIVIKKTKWQNTGVWSKGTGNDDTMLGYINTYKAVRCYRPLPNCLSQSYKKDILSNMYTVGTEFVDGFKPYSMWRRMNNVYCGVALADIGYGNVTVTVENLSAIMGAAAEYMNGLTNLYFEYPLATPIVYTTHPDEAAKFELMQSYQYETNINTNVEPNTKPTINCFVRKLGNRAYTVVDFADENGNILADENGDYIGGLF